MARLSPTELTDGRRLLLPLVSIGAIEASPIVTAPANHSTHRRARAQLDRGVGINATVSTFKVFSTGG